MTRLEAIKSMREGKKVRGIKWEEESYLYIDDKNIIRDNVGNMYGFYRFLNGLYMEEDDIWEIYDETR